MSKLNKLGLILIVAFCSLFMSCNDLDGDNSDYNFGNTDQPLAENPYANGYDRLPNSIRIATYNTHRCEGNIAQSTSVDRSNYDKTAEVIKQMSPDVIALQELDSISTWHKAFQLEELAKRTGMEYTYGYTIIYRGGKYGNGILSKEKPNRVDNIDLVGKEHRKALVAEFNDYVFMATHFCHEEAENRTASVKIINDYAASRYANTSKPIFLAGDFNESNLNSEMFKDLLKNWQIISVNKNTFIGSGSQKRIDFILVYTANSPKYEILGTDIPVFQTVDVNTVSDHLPVLVDLKK